MSGNEKTRNKLIGDLVADLAPVKHPGKTGTKSLLWLAAATLVTIVFMLAGGPFRPGFTDQLLSSVQFSTESALGIVAIVALALSAFRSAIPHDKPFGAQLALPLGLIALWSGFYFYGLYEPALPASSIVVTPPAGHNGSGSRPSGM